MLPPTKAMLPPPFAPFTRASPPGPTPPLPPQTSVFSKYISEGCPVPSTCRSASCSASCFQRSSVSSVYLASSLPTSFAQDWQSQMPLPIARRCSGLSEGSYRGPPGDAAVTCAATPTFRALSSSVCGPLVRFLHAGFEQWLPTRLASISTTGLGKSSRIPAIPLAHQTNSGVESQSLYCQGRRAPNWMDQVRQSPQRARSPCQPSDDTPALW